jgi:cytochrome c oxidase subunit 2
MKVEMTKPEKRRTATFALLMIVGLILILVGSVSAYTAIVRQRSFPSHSDSNEEPQQPVNGISMTVDYWSFEPSTITVKKGETVRLVITSVSNLMPMMTMMFPDHGIDIEDYDIDYTLPVGETVTIEFVADKIGEFHFHCSVYCGIGHEGMHGELIVEE